MTAKDYLDIIANEIHRTIVATVDDSGLPVDAVERRAHDVQWTSALRGPERSVENYGN